MNKLKNFFLDYINWCHPVLSDGTEKPSSLFYKLYCSLFWPIPWQENPCWCCASFRGIIVGVIVGIVATYLWIGG